MNNGPDAAAPKTTAPILQIWQHRNFTLFMCGIGPYYITSWMQRIGVGWLAWQLTHSPFWLGVVAAADLAPMLFLAPIGGAYVDRSDPVKIIKICMNLMTVQAILLAFLTITGLITIEILFALALFTGLILPFYSACRQTIVATSVPRPVFPSAIAMDSSFFHGSRFIGPAIAAITIPWFGVGGTFIAHVFGTVIFFFFQSMMDLKPPDRSGKKRSSLMTDVKEGFVYVYRHEGIWPIFILMTITSVAVRPLQDMLPGFADAIFGAGATGLAWLASGMGIGAMATSVTLAMRGSVAGLTRICIAGCLVLAISTWALPAG
jgi:MFS family permease